MFVERMIASLDGVRASESVDGVEDAGTRCLASDSFTTMAVVVVLMMDNLKGLQLGRLGTLIF